MCRWPEELSRGDRGSLSANPGATLHCPCNFDAKPTGLRSGGSVRSHCRQGGRFQPACRGSDQGPGKPEAGTAVPVYPRASGVRKAPVADTQWQHPLPTEDAVPDGGNGGDSGEKVGMFTATCVEFSPIRGYRMVAGRAIRSQSCCWICVKRAFYSSYTAYDG